jgi:hypothetical protein
MNFLKVVIFGLVLSISGLANAGLIFSDNGTNTIFSITDDISFIATGSSDNITRFIFEDAYSVAPGVQTSGTISNSIGIKINGVPFVGSLSTGSAWGALNFNLGEWDTNDFGISFVNSLNILAGDIVTLTSGTAVLNMPALYKPDLMPTSVTMVTNSANAISSTNTIQVPEPSTLVVFALGIMGLASRQFKKQA